MEFYYIYRRDNANLVSKIFKEIDVKDIEKIYDNSEYIISELYFEYPKIIDGNVVSMSEEEISKILEEKNKITLGYDENGNITDYIIGTYENMFNNQILIKYDEEILNNLNYCKVINNELVYDVKRKNTYELEYMKQKLYSELSRLKNELLEKGFIFQNNLRQPCREQDKTSVTAKILEMQLMKTHNTEWKFFGKDNEHIYQTLTIQDLIQIGIKMGELVTKTMKTESALIEKIKVMDLDELKNIDIEKEFDELYKI